MLIMNSFSLPGDMIIILLSARVLVQAAAWV